MNDVVAWIAVHILPHEADVRRWLRRWKLPPSDIDDLIQESYCRIAAVSRIDRIRVGRAYFFGTARNLVLERLRHERVVRFESLAEMSALDIEDKGPSVEQYLADSQLLVLTKRFIDELPDRCRKVFILRKLKGLSQRDTAQTLNVTENVVEKEIAHGLKTILNRLSEEGLDEGYRHTRRGPGAGTRNQQGY